MLGGIHRGIASRCMCRSYLELETWKVNLGQGQRGPHVVLSALRQRRTWTGKETRFKDTGIKSKHAIEVIPGPIFTLLVSPYMNVLNLLSPCGGYLSGGLVPSRKKTAKRYTKDLFPTGLPDI